MYKLRLYLGELGDPYIEVSVTDQQRQRLLDSQKVNIDDGNVLFAELILDYLRDQHD